MLYDVSNESPPGRSIVREVTGICGPERNFRYDKPKIYVLPAVSRRFIVREKDGDGSFSL